VRIPGLTSWATSGRWLRNSRDGVRDDNVDLRQNKGGPRLANRARVRRTLLALAMLYAGCFESSGIGGDDEFTWELDGGVRIRDTGARDTSVRDSGTASSPPDTSVEDTSSPPVPTTENEYCVEVINGYRAKIGVPPLKRSLPLEEYATKGAESDAKTGRPHGHFMDTSGGGIAWAENEIPGWPGKVHDVITEGCEMMWDEGPGGGHHDNMASTKWKEVGCGIYVTSSGKVWVTQDFR
jgi:hypothetical protein